MHGRVFCFFGKKRIRGVSTRKKIANFGKQFLFPMTCRRIRWWLTGLFVACIVAMQAQEPLMNRGSSREISGSEMYVPQEITLPEIIPFADWNPASCVKPINWERLLNEKVSKERAWEQSVLLSGWTSSPKRITVQSDAAVWNFRIGNHNASWSISNGSHLDARTLRFPVPRHMAPNRPSGSRVAPNGQIKR